MELRRNYQIILRSIWLIVLTAFVAAGVGYAYSKHQPKMYRATASLIVNQGQATNQSYQDVLASQQIAKTYSQIATSWPVLSAAAQKLGLSLNSVSLSCACISISSKPPLSLTISSDVPAGTQLVTITGVSGDPKTASDGTNAVAAAFQTAIQNAQLLNTGSAETDINNQIASTQASMQKTEQDIQTASSAQNTNSQQVALLESQLTQEQSTLAAYEGQLTQIVLANSLASNGVKLVTPARPPSSPFAPRTLFNVLIAALGGVIVSTGAAFLMEYLDDKVRSPIDIERAANGASTLGFIQRFARRDIAQQGLSESLRLKDPEYSSKALESYRVLRSNLEFATAGHLVKTLAICSSAPGEGKTTTACNLAIVLSQTGRRTVLVDGDLRRPAVHKVMELPNSTGLTTLFLSKDLNFSSVLRPSGYENLQLITSGPLPPNPTELLSSPKMREILAALSGSFEFVLIDCPPLLPLADAGEIVSRADAAVIVLDIGRTKLSQLGRSAETVQRSGGRLLGVVMNKIERKKIRSEDYYYYNYSNSYYYGYGGSGQSVRVAPGERRNGGNGHSGIEGTVAEAVPTSSGPAARQLGDEAKPDLPM